MKPERIAKRTVRRWTLFQYAVLIGIPAAVIAVCLAVIIHTLLPWFFRGAPL